MTVYPNGSRTPPKITSDYEGYPGHKGTDSIEHYYNHATDAGVVVMAGRNGTAGIEVRIKHDNYTSRYLHNLIALVNVGEAVTVGQAVGIMGNTGFSFAVHCHYEAWQEQLKTNREWPYRYLAGLIARENKPTIRKENEMKLIRHPNGQTAIVGEFTFEQISPYTSDSLEPVYGAVVKVTNDGWTFHHQMVNRNRALLGGTK